MESIFSELCKKQNLKPEYSTPFQNMIGATIEMLIKKYEDRSKPYRILDINGTGVSAYMLSNIFPLAVIDLMNPEKEVLDAARIRLEHNGNVNFINRDFKSFTTQEHYDMIFCLQTPELNNEVPSLFERFKKLLKRKGKLFYCELGKEVKFRTKKKNFISILFHNLNFKSFDKIFGNRRNPRSFSTSMVELNKNNNKTFGMLTERFSRYFKIEESFTTDEGLCNYLVCSMPYQPTNIKYINVQNNGLIPVSLR